MKTLITDIELLAAALAQVHVTIYEPGAQIIADYGGTVEKYTPDYIKVAGTYFRRDIFVFKAPETRKRPD
ncbi:hypothetical protein [Paenibacillus xylanilyticus]|uniref:hypothetical protein n=1 Tax=Paenibacillus xylanilyticus TaxID=248903 RepID=UPI003AAEED85